MSTQSNLGELMKDPKAAELLKNKDFIKTIMDSPDTKRLMEMLNQNAGGGLKTAASAAAKGDTSALNSLLNQVMRSTEGADVVSRINDSVTKK